MEVNRRSQVERSEATRSALLDAARRLFGEQGYAAVGTEAIVRAAGVTRGALYHQFTDKAELFAAVFEAVEAEVTGRIAALLGADLGAVEHVLAAGIDAWLDVCSEPEVQQIVVLDGPVVLGWEQWREVGLRHGAGLVELVLQAGVDEGRIAPQPVRPLVHILIGALDEAALYVSRSEDPGRAREEMGGALRSLVQALVIPLPPS